MECVIFKPELKMDNSSRQSQLRTTVLAANKEHSSARPNLATTWFFRSIFSQPKASRRQKPIEGRYKTRSATTNPTGKNKLEAGMKGKTVMARPRLQSALFFFFLFDDEDQEVKIKRKKRRTTINRERVTKFLRSVKLETKGTVCMVQSQSRSQGASISQTLRLAR